MPNSNKPHICIHSPGRRSHEAVPSYNLGDVVIEESTERQLHSLLPDGIDIKWSSLHIATNAEVLSNMRTSMINLLAGSNAIGWPWIRTRSSWKITPKDLRAHLNIVLMGVGWSAYETRLNLKTRFFVKNLLDKDALHSTRDRHTVEILHKLGFKNVIYTACPTMWQLTPEHMAGVPTERADVCVTMITDYRKDPERDRLLLAILAKNYKTVLAYPQGTGDKEYLRSLGFSGRILDHDLNFIDTVKKEFGAFDYVGTRLHGGVFCLHNHIRTIIIPVDNRAREISRDTGLVCIEADEDKLTKAINEPLLQDLQLPTAAITEWRDWLTNRLQEKLHSTS